MTDEENTGEHAAVPRNIVMTRSIFARMWRSHVVAIQRDEKKQNSRIRWQMASSGNRRTTSR